MYGLVNKYITKQNKLTVLNKLQKYQFLKKINNAKQSKVKIAIGNNNRK